jgi:hypothetical protein
VFSKADYELAARLLGLPVPQTPAEIAAATPATAEIVRRFGTGLPPMPGMEEEGFYTGATRSLNAPPDNTMPMQKAKLASRLRTETEPPSQDGYLIELLSALDPEQLQLILMLLEQLADQDQEEADRLSSQRPLEYDTPNLGSNYSVLNAPSSNGIEPSRAFQPLS